MESKDEVKAEATRLRQLGYKYKEIAHLLGGVVSVDWCKRNLKQVKLPVTEDACLNEIIQLATRPEGVSVYEANGVIIKHNKDIELTKEKMRQIRDKAKSKNPECLFRPGWISTEKPTESYKAFCSYLLHIQDELDNMVRWYCDSFPETQTSTVKYELLEYLKPTKDGESLSRRINRTEVMCELMEDRLLKAHQESE